MRRIVQGYINFTNMKTGGLGCGRDDIYKFIINVYLMLYMIKSINKIYANSTIYIFFI